MNKSKVSGCLIIVCCLSAVLSGCKDKKADASRPPRPVKAMKISVAAENSKRTFSGQTKAYDEVNLAFRVPGQLIDFPVVQGQKVKKDELIARLDPTDYRIAVEGYKSSYEEAQAKLKAMKKGARNEDVISLEAQLKAAKSTCEEATLQYERFKNLYEKEAVAKAAYDKAKAGYDLAESQVDTLEQELAKARTGARPEDIEAMESRIRSLKSKYDAAVKSFQYTYLKAPFDGAISKTYVDNFQNVAAETPIVKLQNISQIEVCVDLPEDIITQKNRFEKIECELNAYKGKIFPAKIKEFALSPSRQGRTYELIVVIDQIEGLDVFSGMSADVNIYLKNDVQSGDTFIIPETAVFENPGQTYVWIFDEGSSSVSKRPVEIVQTEQDGLRVNGLEMGQWIVTAGVHFLSDGQNVRLFDEPAKSQELQR